VRVASTAVRRIEGPAAIGFAVAFVAGLVLTNVPDEGETRQKAIDFYNSAGEKSRVLVAVYVMAVAALFFVAFTAAVARRLRDVARTGAIAAGAAFVALYLAAAAAFVAPTLTLSLDTSGANTVDEAFVDFARGTSTLGDALLLVCSPFAAAGFVAALARSGALPRWLAWSGFVVAAACLAGFTFVPLLVFAVWMLALGAMFAASQAD
jgi:uncharacterized membrane protein YhaH (DUF805 family)